LAGCGQVTNGCRLVTYGHGRKYLVAWLAIALVLVARTEVPTSASTMRAGVRYLEVAGPVWLAPSGDTSGGSDHANIAHSFTGDGNGVVHLLPGEYYLNATIRLGIGQYLVGAGMGGSGATIINWVGSGDCFWQTYSGPYAGSTTVGGGILNLCIDGASSGPGSSGIHAGDIESLTYDRTLVRNFSGPGDIGYHFDNHYNFTERLHGRLETVGCTSGVVFDVSSNSGPSPDSSTGSFARCDLLIYISSGAVQNNGVVLQNGALLYDMERFSILGNFASASSGTPGAVLTLTGSVPAGHLGAGQGSRIDPGRFDIGVETPANTVTVQTITFGGSGNVILDTFGVLDFDVLAGNPFAPSNVASSGASFRHWGPILGDPTLAATDNMGMRAQPSLVTGGTISTGLGGNVSVNPSSAVAGVVIAAGQRDGQRLTVVNVSANTITFAAAPTSNVAAGTRATVPATTNRLFVWDAAHALWYGGA
jgi:hypothetical protein